VVGEERIEMLSQDPERDTRMSYDSDSPPSLACAKRRDSAASAPSSFRVATFNIENYLDATSSRRCVKSAESKAKVRESIRAMNPDVLALQEVGSVDTVKELRDSLQVEGVDFPHWEHITGSDVDLHIAILSKFPILERRPHIDDSFELNGHRFRVRRGFAEVDVQVNPDYQFTLLVAHLKSRNAVPHGDSSGLRLEEAALLRAKVGARLENGAGAKIIVLGGFKRYGGFGGGSNNYGDCRRGTSGYEARRKLQWGLSNRETGCAYSRGGLDNLLRGEGPLRSNRLCAHQPSNGGGLGACRKPRLGRSRLAKRFRPPAGRGGFQGRDEVGIRSGFPRHFAKGRSSFWPMRLPAACIVRHVFSQLAGSARSFTRPAVRIKLFPSPRDSK
jgi:endonuclease/exonuclease/phosphatase family metal-dependent hydrolase